MGAAIQEIGPVLIESDDNQEIRSPQDTYGGLSDESVV